MPDHELLLDEAARYVMGELNDSERAGFETRMAESAELRAMVRELEEGMTALAQSAPRRQPPANVWRQIEREVARETGWRAMIGKLHDSWWGNGWAAAAACLAAWLLYAVWVNMRPAAPQTHTISDAESQLHALRTNSPLKEGNSPARLAQRGTASTNFAQSEPAGAESKLLRKQLADLKSQLAQMSLSLAQEQAMLGESNRLKFFQMAAGSNDGSANVAQLSPALQKAIFLAMARELGWLPAETSADNDPAAVVRTFTNQWNVDFVDFRPGANNPPATPATTPAQNSGTDNSSGDQPAPNPATSTPGIPAFISGQNLILAIDNSIAAKGSTLTFSTGTTPETQVFQGTTTIGDNPMVVTIPLDNADAAFSSGLGVDIITTSPAGTSTTLQLLVPSATNP